MPNQDTDALAVALFSATATAADQRRAGQALFPLLRGDDNEVGAAVVSRVLARLGASEHGNAWADIPLPTAVQKVTRPATRAAIAKLLFERSMWRPADAFFASLPEDDAHLVFLRAYNFEQLGRSTGDASMLMEGVDLLTRFAPESADLIAERLHCLGHLYAALAHLTGRRSRDAVTSRDLLAQAREANAAYTSCWTSLGSELGDHLATIADSLGVLRAPPEFTDPADGRIVLMEVVFYLGYALSATGEHQRAFECFDVFERVMQQELEEGTTNEAQKSVLREAIGHSQLFRIKTTLRRTPLQNISRNQIQKWLQDLDHVTFTSHHSREMADERERLDAALTFLRRYLSESDLPAHGMAQAARAVSLSLEPAVGNVEAIEEGVPRVNRPPLPLLIEELDAAAWTRAPVPGGTATDPGVARVRGPLPALRMVSLPSVDDTRQPRTNTDNCPMVFTVPGAEYEASAASAIVGDRGKAEAVKSVVQALIAIRRFFDDADYIFSIVPCIDSPAVRFQRPSYGLEDLGLGTAG